MFGKRLSLARVAGVEVRLDASLLLLFILVAWSLALGVFPEAFPQLSPATWWVMGAVSAVGLLLSLLLHELSHSIVARYYGIPVRAITLFLFGGMAEASAEPDRPRSEFLMAIAGPIVSLGLGVILAAAAAVTRTDSIRGVLSYMGTLNIVLAVFNLIPAFPLDGGRILRAALWSWKKDFREATRIASSIGWFFGLLLVVLGIFDVFRGDFLGGTWLFLIGLFLRGAARLSYRQVVVERSLEGETVRNFMSRNAIAVSPRASLHQFADDYLLPYPHKLFPVVDGEKLVGCARMEDLKRFPRDQWESRRVAELVSPCPESLLIGPEQGAREALLRMQRIDSNTLFVAEGGKLVGVVGLKDMMKRLAFKREREGQDAMAA